MQVSIYRVITTEPGSIPATKEWQMVSEASGEHGISDSRTRSEFIVRPPSVIDSDSKPRVGAPVIGKPSTTEGIVEAKNNNFKSARGSSAARDVEGQNAGTAAKNEDEKKEGEESPQRPESPKRPTGP